MMKKCKARRTLWVISVIGLCSCSFVQGAWIWQNWGGAANNPSGTSGSFLLNPLYASYDNGDGDPLPYDPAGGTPNDNDGLGWDRAPEQFNFSWSTTGGETVEFAQTQSFLGGHRYLDVLLDPDMNGTLPTSLTLTVSFPFDLTVRGIGGGGLATNFNPLDMTLDGSLSAFHSDGTPVVLDNTYSFGFAGAPGPNSFSGGNALWNNMTVAGGWYGLNNSAGTASYFPMVPSPNQSSALGQVTWTLSNFRDGNTFLISFDGGVGVNAQQTAFVPEPSRFLLLSIGVLFLCLRRQKK